MVVCCYVPSSMPLREVEGQSVEEKLDEEGRYRERDSHFPFDLLLITSLEVQ